MKNLRIAERQGFEPWEQLPVHRISSAARSTTPASFQLNRSFLTLQMYEYFRIAVAFRKKFLRQQE